MLTCWLICPIIRISPDEVDICDTTATKEIYKTNSRFLKSSFYTRLVPGVENLFSTTDWQYHAYIRRLLATPLSASSVTRLEPLVANRAHMTISRVSEEMASRGCADVYKWWLFMATDIIGERTFGESFRMLESGKVPLHIAPQGEAISRADLANISIVEEPV